MSRLPRISARQLVRALEEPGFVLGKGSHRIYRHSQTGKRVVVPYHDGRTIPPGTLANILRGAGIPREELRDLLRK